MSFHDGPTTAANEKKRHLGTRIVGVQCKEFRVVAATSYVRNRRKWFAGLARGGRNANHFLCV